MDARGDYTQANFILLLTRIKSELFRCHEHLKTQFFACLLSYNKGIILMSQTSQIQFFAFLLNYNKRIVQMSQVSKSQFFACLLALLANWPCIC